MHFVIRLDMIIIIAGPRASQGSYLAPARQCVAAAATFRSLFGMRMLHATPLPACFAISAGPGLRA